MMKKIMLRILFTMIIISSVHLHVKAQTDPIDPGDDPDKIPLDPGIWVLVAAGTGYGIKKWKDKRGENKKEGSVFTSKLLPENKNDNCREV